MARFAQPSTHGPHGQAIDRDLRSPTSPRLQTAERCGPDAGGASQLTPAKTLRSRSGFRLRAGRDGKAVRPPRLRTAKDLRATVPRTVWKTASQLDATRAKSATLWLTGSSASSRADKHDRLCSRSIKAKSSATIGTPRYGSRVSLEAQPALHFSRGENVSGRKSSWVRAANCA